jgi:hypothetical protein
MKDLKHISRFNESEDSKLYTEQEVKEIIDILVRNEKNITYSLSEGRNSVKRFLMDFNEGKYGK